VLPAADRAGAAAAETSPRVPQRSPSTGADAPLPVVLDRLRAALAERDRGLAIALEGVTLLERTDTHLRFAVPDAFAARRLERRLADLAAACERFLGGMRRTHHRGPTAAPPPRAPAAGGGRPRPSTAAEEADRRRRREALDHPAVNAALEILGGDVVEIRPLGGQAPGGKG
jgi:hypothetical protein